jgi:hypothetical protein
VCPRCSERIRITQTVCELADPLDGSRRIYHELCAPASVVRACAEAV